MPRADIELFGKAKDSPTALLLEIVDIVDAALAEIEFILRIHGKPGGAAQR